MKRRLVIGGIIIVSLVGCTGIQTPTDLLSPTATASAQALPTATLPAPTVPPAATPPEQDPAVQEPTSVIPELDPSPLDAGEYTEGQVTGRVIPPTGVVSSTMELAFDLFFENVATEAVSVLSLPEGQYAYTMTLPSGVYQLSAWTPALAEQGAFTACQPDATCEDHSLQPISVTAEATVAGVDVADWLTVETPSLVLVGTLIDGTGADPLADAAVVIRGERIVAVGARGEVPIPVDARVVQDSGWTLLPGFINAHVHNATSRPLLTKWAQAGVTTVRDVGAKLPSEAARFPQLFRLHDRLNEDANNARAIASGPLVTVPYGYPTGNFPSMTLTSPDDARQRIAHLIDDGAEVIKITLTAGVWEYEISMPLETAAAVVETAHARGIPVTAHAAFYVDLITALDAGVDDIGHMILERAPDIVLQRMVDDGVAWVPTLSAFCGTDYYCRNGSDNLRRFVDAGGVVAMGNDSGWLPGLVVGMPTPELERMREAGLTPMEIIVASTRNGAFVCDRLATLGTLEIGKFADVLVVEGDPLQDLGILENVRMVIHQGVVIRHEE